MKQDDPLARKDVILPEDLWDKPLLISQEEGDGTPLFQWLHKKPSSLNIITSYNLLFNASIYVEEGLGYAICFDKIINTSASNGLTFRPLHPELKTEMYLIWKKYQLFSKPAEKLLTAIRQTFSQN